MIFSKNKILEAHKNGDIIYHSPTGYKIEDFTQNQSVDIHLYDWIYSPEYNSWAKITDGKIITKGTFFLACSEEFIGTKAGSNINPQWHLRSTLARLGFGHAKAGWGDVGFHNRWCMEFVAHADLTLTAGMRVAQISFASTYPDDVDYTLETGNYQKENTLEELVANWKKEDILPKQNNI
jgi:deoxycytidine triphosphate deaminase